jgi:hypothetical protein
VNYPVLEEVVGQAIIDRDFCAGLLNGRRARLLSRFSLTPEETQVLSIRADSLEAFAASSIAGSNRSNLHAAKCAWRTPESP